MKRKSPLQVQALEGFFLGTKSFFISNIHKMICEIVVVGVDHFVRNLSRISLL